MVATSDVTKLFDYEMKQLNSRVMRNKESFLGSYCFQLNEEEYEDLRCQIGTSSSRINNYGGRRYLPYVFTEYGITMLAGILRS